MKYLVVDSGPLIKGVRLERFGAERYVTVPEVLGELRDSQARALLESLPFDLELREPSDEASIPPDFGAALQTKCRTFDRHAILDFLAPYGSPDGEP